VGEKDGAFPYTAEIGEKKEQAHKKLRGKERSLSYGEKRRPDLQGKGGRSVMSPGPILIKTVSKGGEGKGDYFCRGRKKSEGRWRPGGWVAHPNSSSGKVSGGGRGGECSREKKICSKSHFVLTKEVTQSHQYGEALCESRPGT